jgi:radical SAM-linked protein
LILEGLKGKPVRVKWNDPEQSWLEGIFSRGDRRLSKVLMEAWKLGARFDAWGEHFNTEVWKQAFKHTGVDPHFYLHRERSLDEVLPWDHIRSGIHKAYFIKEWKKAQREEFTPDCREKCLECGVCDHKVIDPILFKGWNSTHSLKKPPVEIIPSPSRKYRLTFTKLGHAKYLGHLELVRVFVRAIKRAGLNIVYSTGYHPMPKISFACAIPVGTESMQETVEIQVAKPSNIVALKESINRQLPSGISVTFVEEIALTKKKERLKESHFLITLNGVELKEEGVTRFLKSDNFPVVKVNKKREHKINVRALVKSMSLISPNGIKLVMKHASGPELKPAEIVKSVFSLNEHHVHKMKILKTKQVLG